MLTIRRTRYPLSKVRGLTKKGKEFYRIEPALGEKIQQVIVCNTNMWIIGEHSVFCYDNDRALATVTCPADITCCEYVPMAGGAEHCIVLGCADGILRVVLRNALHFEAPLRSPLTALRFQREGPSARGSGLVQCELAFGCRNGAWGRLAITAQGMTLLSRQAPQQSTGAVTALHSMLGLTGASTRELVVAYESSLLQVFRATESNELLLCCSNKVGDAVVNLDAGHALDAGTMCIVAHTQSGRVLAYTAGSVPILTALAGGIQQVLIWGCCVLVVAGSCSKWLGIDGCEAYNLVYTHHAHHAHTTPL